MDPLVVLLGFLEGLQPVSHDGVDLQVKLFVRKGLKQLYQDDEDFLRDGSLAFNFGFLAVGRLAVILLRHLLASLLHNVHDADGQEIVDEEELVDHVLLSTLLRVQQLLPLVLLDALL